MTRTSNNASVDHRLFTGGSAARIIVSTDEAALIRLWVAPIPGQTSPAFSARRPRLVWTTREQVAGQSLWLRAAIWLL
jgi:hypothetical protein